MKYCRNSIFNLLTILSKNLCNCNRMYNKRSSTYPKLSFMLLLRILQCFLVYLFSHDILL